MSVFTRVARGRLAAWLTVVAAIVLGAAVFGLPQPENPAPVSSTGLSVQWQSTQVERLQDELPDSEVQPAIVVVSRADGGPLTEPDRTAVTGASASSAGSPPAAGSAPRRLPRRRRGAGRRAARTAGGQDDVAAGGRAARRAGRPAGRPRRAGHRGPAFQADIANAFAGADFSLLLVTAAVVAVLLIVTYRSPVLWIVPLVVVGVADRLAARRRLGPRRRQPTCRSTPRSRHPLGAGLRRRHELRPAARSPATARSCAATTTATPRCARPCAERGPGHRGQRRHRRARPADPAARRSSPATAPWASPARSASSSRSRSALLVLPAALVVCGAGCSGRSCPAPSASPGPRGRARRLGAGSAAACSADPRPSRSWRPRCVGWSRWPRARRQRVGLSQTEQFRVEPESVTGAGRDRRAVPGRASEPTVVLTPAAATAVAARSPRASPASRPPGRRAGGRPSPASTCELDAEPESDAASADRPGPARRLRRVPEARWPTPWSAAGRDGRSTTRTAAAARPR